MAHHPFAYVRPLSFGHCLGILGDRHMRFASHHKQDPQLVDLPQILPVERAAIDDDGAHASSRSQIALRLL